MAERDQVAQSDERLSSDQDTEKRLSGGELLSAISARVVGLLREHYGRGPMKAKTYVLDDLVVCVLRNGMIPVEATMMERGEPDRVVEMRHEFQKMMGTQYKEAIEELTGRRVIAFLSQAHMEPDITLEAFVMDGPLLGFGAVEVVQPREVPGGPTKVVSPDELEEDLGA